MADGKKSQGRTSVLADGTTVDQDYYQSKNYILEQLNAKRSSSRKTDPNGEKGEKLDSTTNNMVASGAVSADDGWLLASMETPLRNPFCVANHGAKEQMLFYQKVFLVSAVFMGFVAISTICWTWWWRDLMINQNMKPIMPCKGIGSGKPFGKVKWCNEAESDTALTDDGCDENAALSVCVDEACFDNEDQMRSCWYVAAFVMVIMAAYMMLLFRRDQAGKGLLSSACFIEGIVGGAATLHYDSSIFVEFFTYLCGATVMGLILISQRHKAKLPEWEKLPNQVGSLNMNMPEVEKVVFPFVKQNFLIGTGVVTIVAFLWHFAIPARLTGGSHLAFFMALICLWISVAWLLREMSWTQHKYDPEQFVNMCISFHVDLYCIFILFMIFVCFAFSDACHQGPVMCGPAFCQMCALQCERCTRFGCGCGGSAAPAGSEASGDGEGGGKGTSEKKSVHVDKEVETEEQYKKRKMINGACIAGIMFLGALSFFVPHITFAVATAICVFLPFFRAKTSKEEEQQAV